MRTKLKKLEILENRIKQNFVLLITFFEVKKKKLFILLEERITL